MEPFSCWRVDTPLAVGSLEAKEAIVDGNDVAGVPQDECICPSTMRSSKIEVGTLESRVLKALIKRIITLQLKNYET